MIFGSPMPVLLLITLYYKKCLETSIDFNTEKGDLNG